MANRSAKHKILSFIKDLLPPILGKTYRKIVPYKRNDITWTGNYKSWDEAQQNSVGYDNPAILEKTKQATLTVKAGQAAFERDTVLFYEYDYNWPLLAIILKAAVQNNGKVSIIDFGGALGSAYFQHLPMLRSIKNLEWSIIEQGNYISVGNEFIADDCLKFYPTVTACLAERQPDILLLFGVLQYLEAPHEVLADLLAHNFEYIIIDRMSLIDDAADRLTIQTVPPQIYAASYPSWFLNSKGFEQHFTGRYTILQRFKSDIIDATMLDQHTRVYWQSYILQKNG